MTHLASIPTSGRRVPRSSGFTLVELLVASALMTVLLAGLWGLIDIFTSLAAKGGRQTHELRSAVGFFREVEHDLRSIPDAVLPASNMPLFYGSTSMIQFWIRQAPSLEWIHEAELAHGSRQPTGFESPTATLTSDPLTGQETGSPGATQSRPIDLRRIRYELFSSAALSNEALRAAHAGARLVRDASGPVTAPPPLANDPGLPRPETADGWEPADSIPRPTNLPMIPLTELTPFPDVEAVRFAYYNGTAWQSHWNSMLHGGLPHAVRVDVWFHGGSHLTPPRLVDETGDSAWQLDDQSPSPAPAMNELIDNLETDPLPVRPVDLSRLVVLRSKTWSTGSATR